MLVDDYWMHQAGGVPQTLKGLIKQLSKLDKGTLRHKRLSVTPSEGQT